MKRRTWIVKLAPAAVFGATLLLGLLSNTPPSQARDGASDERSQLGMTLAPVPLNLVGRNQTMVGLGSYLVNVVGDCNGCHTSASAAEFAAGRNPYFGQPKMINPAVYLGGGRDFGALVPNSPDIVSRNITPDKTGMPGGHTFPEFYQIMQTGVDLDHLHPSCSTTVTANCLPAPFNGAVLQIMAWPVYQNFTYDDFTAIYEYLSAIPCLEGGPGEPAVRCH